MRILLLCLLSCLAFGQNLARFSPGDVIRLKRGEMLQFQGKDLTGAAKGQEFSILKHDVIRHTLFVSFVKKGGQLVAVTLPEDAADFIPPTPWADLLAGVEAYRDGSPAIARARIANAAKDSALAPIAAPLLAAIGNASLPELRQLAAQLDRAGHATLALAVDIGADRFGRTSPSMIDRKTIATKAAATHLALLQARQDIGLHRGIAALDHLNAGLAHEPARPDFQALKAQVEKNIVEAGERCDDANRMRRFAKGAVHALTAIEMGLKLCADHPRLRALRKDMEAQFTVRTSPPVTPDFMKIARVNTAETTLKKGHELYTSRCTECHDLELLDSRSMESWRSTVAGMARRAGLDGGEQAQILDYLAAAKIAVSAADE